MIVRRFIVFIGLFCVIGLAAGCQMEQQPVVEEPTATLPKEATITERPLPTATATLPPTETAVVTSTPMPSPTATVVPTETAVVLPDSLPDPVTWTSIGTPVPPAEDVITAENVAELTEVARWGKGQVLDAVYAPDGSKLYVLTAQGVYVYETASARQLDYRPYENVPSRMALSPDGRLLAVAMQNDPRYVELRDAVDNTFITAFLPAAEANAVLGLHFDQSGETLFIHVDSAVDEVIAWDIVGAAPLTTLAHVDKFAFAPPGALAATIADGATAVQLEQWQNGTLTAVTQLPFPEIFVDHAGELAISADGKYVALAQNRDGTAIAVWRVADGALLYILNEAERDDSQGKRRLPSSLISGFSGETISDLHFSADSELLAAATSSQNAALWHVTEGQLVQELPQIGSGIAVAPDNQVLAAWRYGLNQWRVDGGQYLNGPTQHIGPVNDFVLMPARNQLAIASQNKFIYLRDVVDGSSVVSLPTAANGIDTTANGDTLASAFTNYQVWHLADNSSLILEPSPQISLDTDIVISFDGQFVLGTGYDRPLSQWQMIDGSWEYTELSFFNTSAMAFSSVDHLVALTDFVDGLMLWHPEWGDDFEPLPLDSEIEGMTLGYVSVFTFSPDGRYLAAGTHEGIVLLWEIEEREATFIRAVTELDAVLDVAFSPDNALIAVKTPKAVVFVDRQNGRLLQTLSIPIVGEQIVFGENGRYLITGHRDGSVRTWAIP